MREIILPIKPKYVEQILMGTKTVEYRKWIPSCGLPFKVIIYASAPVKQIVGCFVVNEIIQDNPTELWETTNIIGGIDEKSFFSYFGNKLQAYAFKISELEEFKPHKSLQDYGLSEAPQRFAYVN